MESSHLVVSYLKTAPDTGAGPTRNGASGAGPLGAFGDIIDKIVATVSGQKSGESVALNGSGTTLGAAKTSDTTKTSDTAKTSSTTPLGANADTAEGPKLMSELVKELAAIEKAEKAGKPVDPDLLKKLKKTVDALAALLGVPQQTPTPTTTTPASDATNPKSAAVAASSLLNATSSADNKPALSGPTTQLANLAKKAETLATDIGKNQPDLAAKLDALAQKLGSGTLSADNLKTLGLNANGAPADPTLNNTINALIAAKSTPTPAPGPQFADAALHLPGTSTFNAKGANTNTGNTDSSTAQTSATSTGAARPDVPANAIIATHDTSDRQPGGDGKSKSETSTSGAGVDAKVAVTATGTIGTKPVDPSALTTSVQATTPPVDGTTAAKAIASAYQPATANVNLPQMAFQIARHAQGGNNSFQIRLDPADMGKVDVRLDIGATGTVNAHLSVERADTLALLRRDAGALSQALTQAGLDASKTNLQFSLNQNPFARQDNAPGGQHANGSGAPFAGTADADPGPIIITHYRGTLAASGLNIFV